MAEHTRTSRDLETRAKLERPKQWMPPQLLPDPTPEPGYNFRWIRISTLGEADPRHISSKLREGWEPVKASMHPEIQMMAGQTSRFPDSMRSVVYCFAKHLQKWSVSAMSFIRNKLMLRCNL